MNSSNQTGQRSVTREKDSAYSWPVIGHDGAVASLTHAISMGYLRHAYLITGSSGIGKRTLAMAFVQAVLCSETNVPCGKCRTCRLVGDGRHPDVIVLNPLVKGKVIKTGKITIDPIRELIRRFSLSPLEAARRIAVISGFEAATEAAANALLKTLEEPPGDSILVLTATRSEQLLPTIVSRCEELGLRPLSRLAIQRALTDRWDVPVEKARLFARLSAGRLGWAVNMLTDVEALDRRVKFMQDMITLLKSSRVERFAYADRLRKDREAVLEALGLWQGWWRDVLLVTSHVAGKMINIDFEDEIRTVAGSLDPVQASKCVMAIHNVVEQLEKNANPRLALEVLMLELPWLNSH